MVVHSKKLSYHISLLVPCLLKCVYKTSRVFLGEQNRRKEAENNIGSWMDLDRFNTVVLFSVDKLTLDKPLATGREKVHPVLLRLETCG